MTAEIAAKIANMQRKNLVKATGVHQKPDGLWYHPLGRAGFQDKDGAETDFRFSKEWGCK